MPTLLSINNYYYRRGGAEAVFLEENRLFEEIGWETATFAMSHPDNLPSKWGEFYVDELEFGESYSMFGKLKRASKVIYSLEARHNLERLLGTVSPTVAHIHNIYHHLSPSILTVLKKHGIPTVMTLHDLKLACPAYKMLDKAGICERCKHGKIYNVMLHRCIKDSLALSTLVLIESMVQRLFGLYRNNVDRFIVPSRFYLEKMVEWGFNRSNFVYIPNFVDVRDYELCANTTGQGFVYFGRLSSEKGVETLIEASVLAKVPLRIVGSGPYEKLLRKRAEELGGEISFTGHVTGDHLKSIVRSARAVVLPSEWYENSPMSIMEAYALGVPVIGADIGGIPELIRHEETGYIFESGSSESLAKVLRKVSDLSDKEVGEMGRCGRSLVESEYSSDAYRDRLLGLYSELRVL